MGGEWPLVGRAADLERLGTLLRGGAGGVVLAGPAGVGKTRLAVEGLALAAERGFVPIRVAATQAAAHLPFGAFAPLLPDLPAGVDRTEVLRQVGRAIVGRGEGKPVALLVDDAHRLDESSAVLVHQLAGVQDTFVLATVRSGEPASDAVMALWKDGLAQRIEVGPLSRAGVDSLLTAVLGGSVDGATVHHLYERSEGNLLFLKELVLAALDTGGLRGEGGLWRLHEKLAASDRLVELIEARLGGLAEAHRGVLEVVALGEPLGVDLVEGPGDEAGLDGLARRQLVRFPWPSGWPGPPGRRAGPSRPGSSSARPSPRWPGEKRR